MNGQYLIHRSTGKSNKDVKYYEKIAVANNKYRYFYTKEEYDAYLRGQKTATNVKTNASANSGSNASKKTTEVFSKGKSLLEDLFSGVKKITTESMKNAAATGEKAVQTIVKTKNNIVNTIKTEIDKSVDKTVDTVKTSIGNTYDATNKYLNEGDRTNIYDINSQNYDENIEKIKKTPEWQKIVETKDPEYVRLKPDGTYEYKIDDYIVKKKHPVLDVMDDVINYRNIDTNEFDKKAMLAGIKDYAVAARDSVAISLGAIGMFAMAKFKQQQGSYDDEIEQMKTAVENGKTQVDAVMKTMNDLPSAAVTTDVTAVAQTVLSTAAKSSDNNQNGQVNNEEIIKLAMQAVNGVANSQDAQINEEMAAMLAIEIAKVAINTSTDNIDPEITNALVDEVAKLAMDEMKKRRQA